MPWHYLLFHCFLYPRLTVADMELKISCRSIGSVWSSKCLFRWLYTILMPCKFCFKFIITFPCLFSSSLNANLFVFFSIRLAWKKQSKCITLLCHLFMLLFTMFTYTRYFNYDRVDHRHRNMDISWSYCLVKVIQIARRIIIYEKCCDIRRKWAHMKSSVPKQLMSILHVPHLDM